MRQVFCPTYNRGECWKNVKKHQNTECPTLVPVHNWVHSPLCLTILPYNCSVFVQCNHGIHSSSTPGVLDVHFWRCPCHVIPCICLAFLFKNCLLLWKHPHPWDINKERILFFPLLQKCETCTFKWINLHSVSAEDRRAWAQGDGMICNHPQEGSTFYSQEGFEDYCFYDIHFRKLSSGNFHSWCVFCSMKGSEPRLWLHCGYSPWTSHWSRGWSLQNEWTHLTSELFLILCHIFYADMWKKL